MITRANAEKIKDIEGLWTISALTHRQIVSLLERKLIQPQLFDEKQIIEAIDPDRVTKIEDLRADPFEW